MLPKINNLLKYCLEDSITDKFSRIEFQLFLLTSKSLIPFEDKVGNMINLNRYKKELEIFKYYQNGKDELTDYIIQNNESSNLKDSLIEYKILPIAIANTDWDILLNEIIKFVLFYTYNKNTIIDSILLSSFVFEYLSNDEFEAEEIINITKERLIQFSLKDTKSLSEYFNNNIDKKYIIEFEKARIKLLMNGIITEDKINEYKLFQHIINKSKPIKEVNIDNDVLLDNFSSYLFKLRKGIISPEKLKFTDEKIPDFKMYLQKPVFNHPLLGKCVVITKNDKEIILKNKLGLLRVNV